ncbi:fumarylacetoacetate hydrolase family protein [Saccharospirillum mangrovi]|uniref:fumarylacetoacetate hydrolase family protein n=1 Tax=Saccharospirillum mangrovi TaxID=2161747 RepID=UPI000D3D4120|nr:fumarylacetoacetate hydrolase family protein [Saccharospirillum mangrovi]
MFTHRWWQGETLDLPVGKAVCIGRNYAEHARELNNPVPKQPLLFHKPATAFCELSDSLQLARPGLHFETELALLIGAPLNAQSVNPWSAVIGVTLALDLTDRDLQAELKQAGHPWERAKAFDGALPIGTWLPIEKMPANVADWSYRLDMNGALRQHGQVSQMLCAPAQLLELILVDFSLQPGDVVLTGTPAGVGVLSTGDDLLLRLDNTDWQQRCRLASPGS